MNKIDCWPPKNGESSTAAQKYGERSTCDSSNRVIMLQGLDPNSTQGRIRKAFEDNGLKVTVDYQRDDTIGYVHLHLPMAKEVVHRITSSGGLRVGSEYVVLRALEGTEEVMYWTVYAASNLPTSLRSPGKSKKLLTKGRRKMRSRSYPYPSMDIDEDVDQPFDKALSKLQKKKSSRLKRAIKKPRKIPNNRTAAKQFHMQLKAAINMDIDTSNSLVKKEGINSSMSRFLSSSPMIISERLSDYSLQSIQESQSFADIITTETTNSSGMFGISSHSQQFYHRSTRQQASASMELRDNVYSSITSDETDEVEKKFKYLSVNSGNELMKKFSGEYYQ